MAKFTRFSTFPVKKGPRKKSRNTGDVREHLKGLKVRGDLLFDFGILGYCIAPCL